MSFIINVIDVIALTVLCGGMNWAFLAYTLRKLERFVSFAPNILERVVAPLDAALEAETATPGKLTRAQLYFYIREARKELVRAGAKPFEPPNATKLLKEPPLEGSDLDTARRTFEADKWFAPLIGARDALGDGVTPDTSPKQALVIAVVCMLDALIRALHRTRYQGGESNQRLAERLVQVAVHLDPPEEPPAVTKPNSATDP